MFLISRNVIFNFIIYIDQILRICLAFCFIVLFLSIQIVGVRAMATIQVMAGPLRSLISRSLINKVSRRALRLKQQKVMNPVVRETDS